MHFCLLVITFNYQNEAFVSQSLVDAQGLQFDVAGLQTRFGSCLRDLLLLARYDLPAYTAVDQFISLVLLRLPVSCMTSIHPSTEPGHVLDCCGDYGMCNETAA